MPSICCHRSGSCPSSIYIEFIELLKYLVAVFSTSQRSDVGESAHIVMHVSLLCSVVNNNVNPCIKLQYKLER